MSFGFRHKMFCYLAGAAMGFPSGNTNNTTDELGLIPERTLIEFIDDVGNEKWKRGDLLRLAEVLLQDDRTTIKERILQILPQSADSEFQSRVEGIFMGLSSEPDRAVRKTVSIGFATWLEKLEEMDRTEIICRWVLSSEGNVREMMARTLAGGVTGQIGISSAISLLSNDTEDDVRLAAVAASEAQFGFNPPVYAQILRNLNHDTNEDVRGAAKTAFNEIKDWIV
ncbi:MAG: hypothetical protein JXR91_16630 [Deltaproteobacteria bacterium]|nr:hypothetical protein [Deltaproteobacteria bacterium]